MKTYMGFLLFIFLVPANAVCNVPDWAKHAIWYQIFPERFRNGDPANDPPLTDILGSWPHDSSSNYQVSNWTGDWYAFQDWEKEENGDFYFHVQRRRYGGDLQGVIDKLDYLQDLGITAIYFNPLFESPSLHKYDGASFHHIDDNFGPRPDLDKQIVATEKPIDPATWKWTSADSLFLKLINECHARNIRVVIDGVFNHVGLNFWAFRDVVKNQQNSKYKDWFTVKSWDDPATSVNEFNYEGWAGVRELPELKEDENGILPEPKEYIFNSVQRWMDPNNDGNPEDGIDGWRLDVAEKVNENFWRDFRLHVKSINPDAYLVGEVWWEDWQQNKMFNARPWLEGDIFDAVMNYRLAKEIIHFFVDQKKKISATVFAQRVKALYAEYPEEVNYVLMNLMDSHDTDRLASQIINFDDDYDHRDNVRENPQYSVRKPNQTERNVQKLLTIFQMTWVGAPMIYYGDEAGMWGADDPDCRKPMLWNDLAYEPETSHPLGKMRPIDENSFDSDLFHHYQKLINIRKQNPALQTGDFKFLITDDQKDILAFSRNAVNETVIVALNNSDKSATIKIPVSGKKVWQDELTGERFSVESGHLNVELSAKQGMILK